MNKKLWGGRFAKKINPLLEKFSRSVQYDYKLAEFDVLGSIAHVQILKKSSILKPGEAAKLIKGLRTILKKIDSGKFKADYSYEDIHSQIQDMLYRSVGPAALKLQTARSRNEQVAFATKLYAKSSILELQEYIIELEIELCVLAKKNKDVIVPGFTHMQHAQPVYLSDHLAAYAEMLKRDYVRLSYIFENIVMTMGSGAIAGTPIPSGMYKLDALKYMPSASAKKAFDIKPTDNSIDTVSDRDFVIDILSALSVLGMHLSRFAEEMIIWATKEFDFVEIDEAYCTGSSLMPQKKNADSLELVRGYSSRLYGNLMSVLTMMKSLPLAYNRDMQLDKEPLFNSIEIVSDELNILKGLVSTLTFNKENIRKYLEDEALYATDLVYYLVGEGVAFKNAHTIIGRLVKHSQDNGLSIKDMTDEELKSFSDKLNRRRIAGLFDPGTSVKSKRSFVRKCTYA